MKKNQIFLLGIFLLMMGGCEDEFDAYSDVKGMRLLAMKADKPQLLPGEKATMSALVSEEVSYAWSWCPFTGGAATGYSCAISHEQLQGFADMGPGGPGALIIPDYNLGTSPTAEFTHDIPPEFYRAICELILSRPIPNGFAVPSCEDSFELMIKLEASKAGETIVGVATLDVLLESDASPNNNPVLEGITIQEVGGGIIKLDSAKATPMKRGVSYELKLEIGEDSAESYVGIRPGGTKVEENRENLVASWFHEGGELKDESTTFLPGSIKIDILQTNEWIPPSIEEHPESRAKLYFVVRDGRGGLSWQTREIELVVP